MSLWQELAIIVLLTVLNGVFSGAEIALLAVRKTRLQELTDSGNKHAKAALQLRSNPERLLATIQVGITFIGATTAVFGGARLAAPFARLLSGLGVGRAADGIALVLVIVLVSYLSLVIGELVPKSLALRTPERFAFVVARGLAALAAVSKPLVWLLTASSNFVLRPFRDRTTFAESRLSPDELQQLLEESAAAGNLQRDAGEIASRAIDLGHLKANALMTPRAKIVSIDADASRSTAIAMLQTAPHARYPVIEAELGEKIVGYLVARELYDVLLSGVESPVRQLLRPIACFAKTTPAVEVLRALQTAKQHLGLLIDERGETTGLISIEDIAEDVLGDILEEHEVPRPLAWKSKLDASIIALGEAPLHEVSRLLREDLEPDNAVATIAGLLAQKIGRVPLVGEKVMLGPNVEAKVLEASLKQVTKARLRVLGKERQ